MSKRKTDKIIDALLATIEAMPPDGGFVADGESEKAWGYATALDHVVEELEKLRSSPTPRRYIVTVKVARHPFHDPKNKITDSCATSHECTDSTGAHHSVLATGQRGLAKVITEYDHITRIEEV